jgi:hypothetical protein
MLFFRAKMTSNASDELHPQLPNSWSNNLSIVSLDPIGPIPWFDKLQGRTQNIRSAGNDFRSPP